MSTIGSNVSSARIALGLSISELARRSKWDRANLSRLEKGEGGFSKESLARLAEALNISQSVLFDEKSNVVSVPQGTRRIPVIDYVQAGNWTGANAAIEAEFDSILADHSYPLTVFALRIKGDSMRPGFEAGDVVVIDPGVAPLPGDFVVAANGDEGVVFKQYRERERGAGGRVIFDLHPLNDMYPVLRGDALPLRIVGTMVEYRRYRKHR